MNLQHWQRVSLVAKLATSKKLICSSAMAIAAISLSLIGIAEQVLAATPLPDNQALKGNVSRYTTPIYIDGVQYFGDEYTFQANAGDQITIDVIVPAGSNLNPEVQLIYPSNSSVKVAANTLQRTLYTPGTYIVRVVGTWSSQGNYAVSLSRTNPKDVANAVTTGIEKISNTVTQNNQNPIPSSWGLTAVNCGSSSAGLVEISFQNKTGCAIPSPQLSAGRYVFNGTELIPVVEVLTPQIIPNPTLSVTNSDSSW